MLRSQFLSGADGGQQVVKRVFRSVLPSHESHASAPPPAVGDLPAGQRADDQQQGAPEAPPELRLQLLHRPRHVQLVAALRAGARHVQQVRTAAVLRLRAVPGHPGLLVRPAPCISFHKSNLITDDSENAYWTYLYLVHRTKWSVENNLLHMIDPN